MNANQVVIVERAVAEDCAAWGRFLARPGVLTPSMVESLESLRVALDRDPDEMEARIAEALAVEGWPEEGPVREGSNQHQFLSRLARAVLHALQEGTEK